MAAAAPSARVARPPSDAFPRPPAPVAIDLEFDLVRRRLGLPVDDREIAERLASLGFAVEPAAGGARVGVPTWRATKDVAIPEDLVEEVGRLHGYERIVPTPAPSTLTPATIHPARVLEREGKAVLSLDLGYAEVAAYSFCGPKDCERTGLDPAAHLRLANPLSAEQDRMVLSTVPNLLRAAVRNQASFPSFRLCEWARVFPTKDPSAPGFPAETRVVGLLAFDRALHAPDADREGAVFLGVKEDVLALLDRLGIGGLAVADAEGGASIHPLLPSPPFLHPGRRAAVSRDGAVLALVGELQPFVARAWGLEGRVAVAEVNLDAALAGGRTPPEYRPVPRFPVVPFDVAVVVPRRTPAAAVGATIAAVAPGSVRDVECFDVYEGSGIAEGQRSLAFRMTLLDEGGTLSAKAADALRAKVLDALRGRGWSVRTAAPGSS